jgi:TPR repeat protein
MKRVFLIFSVLLTVSIYAQNLYFEAFKDIKKAKKIVNSDPQKAQRLFIEAYGYLKQIVNNSIDKNKPSANAFNLLGELYLKGWGVEKNEKKAKQFLCAAKLLGNLKAAKTLDKLGIKCKKINFKELKQ